MSYSDYIFIKVLGKGYRVNKCDESLLDRFGQQGKYQHKSRIDENPNLICTIAPTNNFDIQALLEIANKFLIPIKIDCNERKNDLHTPHIKIDYKNFNEVLV